jgi:hypothetical protein
MNKDLELEDQKYKLVNYKNINLNKVANNKVKLRQSLNLKKVGLKQ